jgi:hypothetical protein
MEKMDDQIVENEHFVEYGSSSLHKPIQDRKRTRAGEELLENPGIHLPYRIQTVSLKVLDLEFKVLDEII